MKLLIAYVVQVAIAADQFLNALIPPLTGTLSWSDETLSARCFRSWRDGRPWGRVMLPVIDFLFAWQGHDDGISSHCARAYMQEKQRRAIAPEYRNPDANERPAP